MLDRNSIKQTLIEIMEADTGETYADLEDTGNLRTDLGLDSVDVVSIVSQVERHFRLRLSQQDLEKLVTLSDLLDLLEVKIKEAEAAQPKAA
jgi:acyl carrier protein